MNYRKLISFGKGGFVISVPKNWITENNLQKGSIISVDQKENTIVLSPQSSKSKSEVTQCSIVVDGLSSSSVLSKMTHAYLNSTTLITLSGKELPKMLSDIKSHVHNSIALEIIDSEKNKLVVKDYLNFSDVSIPSVFRKMDMVLRSIFTDLTGDDDPTNALLRLNEVNRHFLLLAKALKKASQDHSLLKTFGTSFSDLFTYLEQGLALKSIGDEMQRYVEVLAKTSLNKNSRTDLNKVVKKTESFYLEVMKSLSKTEKHQGLYGQQHDIYKAVDAFQKNYPQASILAEVLRVITSRCECIVGRLG